MSSSTTKFFNADTYNPDVYRIYTIIFSALTTAVYIVSLIPGILSWMLVTLAFCTMPQLQRD